MSRNTQFDAPGLLMRVVEGTSDLAIAPKQPCPNIDGVCTGTEDDQSSRSLLALYFLSDVRPLISSSDLYDQDVASQNTGTSVSWVVCSFINGRVKDKSSPNEGPSHRLSHRPAEGSRLVINGSSPRSEKEDDYNQWYDQEHGPMLSAVPGWNENKRYRLEKTYGDIETASFYGFNFYDAENGLGGPEWKASTNTEWTKRVRSNHTKANVRRVWTIRTF